MPGLFLAISKRNACAYYGIPGTGSLIKLLNCSHRISSAFGWAFKKAAFTLSEVMQYDRPSEWPTDRCRAISISSCPMMTIFGWLAVQTTVWQLNRWPCPWLTDSVSHFWFWNIWKAIYWNIWPAISVNKIIQTIFDNFELFGTFLKLLWNFFGTSFKLFGTFFELFF